MKRHYKSQYATRKLFFLAFPDVDCLLQWSCDNVPCECTFEKWITLDGRSVVHGHHLSGVLRLIRRNPFLEKEDWLLGKGMVQRCASDRMYLTGRLLKAYHPIPFNKYAYTGRNQEQNQLREGF